MAILTIFQIVWLAFLPPFVHLLCSSLFQLVDSGVVAHRNGAFWAHYDEKPHTILQILVEQRAEKSDIRNWYPDKDTKILIFSLESKTEEFHERYIRRKCTHTNESHALQKMRHPTRYKDTISKNIDFRAFFRSLPGNGLGSRTVLPNWSLYYEEELPGTDERQTTKCGRVLAQCFLLTSEKWWKKHPHPRFRSPPSPHLIRVYTSKFFDLVFV